MIIAIDGSAASGKGTLAKQLAQHLKLAHLDTGSLYRALGLQLLNAGFDTSNINKNQSIEAFWEFDLDLLNSSLIRSDEVAQMASVVAAMPLVRAKFLDLQQNFARHPPHGAGAILDGRDIGTVVLPDADFKFFIDAKIEVRADRRTKELLQTGQSVMFRDVLLDMRERDMRDSSRSVAPLRPADDAIIIDTSSLDAHSVFTLALSFTNRLSAGT